MLAFPFGVREDIKYYFADFVRKGGGGLLLPKSVTFFLTKILSVKGGGGTPLTDKIRKVVFEVFPKSNTNVWLTGCPPLHPGQ